MMRQRIAKDSVHVKRVATLSFVLLTVLGRRRGIQGQGIDGRRDGRRGRNTRRPLSNAEVIDMLTGQQRVTDEHGLARVQWPSSGDLRLRVRQVGYRFVDRTLKHAADGSADTITVALSRVVFTLPQVLATSQCSRRRRSGVEIPFDCRARAASRGSRALRGVSEGFSLSRVRREPHGLDKSRRYRETHHQARGWGGIGSMG